MAAGEMREIHMIGTPAERQARAASRDVAPQPLAHA
jgi:hypothetical protein